MSFQQLIWLLFAHFVAAFSHICVDVLQTQRGYPRINHNGYAYGLKSRIDVFTPNKRYTWYCTRLGHRSSSACRGKMETTLINDKMMMNTKPTVHVCKPLHVHPSWIMYTSFLINSWKLFPLHKYTAILRLIFYAFLDLARLFRILLPIFSFLSY